MMRRMGIMPGSQDDGMRKETARYTRGPCSLRRPQDIVKYIKDPRMKCGTRLVTALRVGSTELFIKKKCALFPLFYSRFFL